MTASVRARGARTIWIVALIVASIGLIDGLLTRPGAWHAALERPSWHPPAGLFGPVWAFIGIAVTFAAAHAWDAMRGAEDRARLMFLLALNAVLNVAWSALFFTTQRPDLAVADIALLWLSIATIIAFLSRRAPAAAWLFAPYLLWITIASVLNFEIVRLNGPF